MEVSIVITNYNYGEYLERCIRSCQSQVFDGKYEIIVVDDCSTDHSSRILEMYGEDSLVNVILNQDNMGVAGSANIGIKAARGQFVVRVDADVLMALRKMQLYSALVSASGGLGAPKETAKLIKQMEKRKRR